MVEYKSAWQHRDNLTVSVNKATISICNFESITIEDAKLENINFDDDAEVIYQALMDFLPRETLRILGEKIYNEE